jgi:copper homeostasis protein
MTIEICCDGFEKELSACEAGADRIELCQELAIGGTTPPHETIRRVVSALNIPVNVLIRPRGGDFVYAHSEVGQILDDIRFCGELLENGKKVNGVVFGALLRDGSVDTDATREMAREAHRQGLSTTFHRAIDESADIFKNLQAIMDIGGIDRILTSGGASDAYSGRMVIAEMVRMAHGKLSIMAGCGVTAANATAIAAATGIHEIHGSRLEIIPALRSEQASSA